MNDADVVLVVWLVLCAFWVSRTGAVKLLFGLGILIFSLSQAFSYAENADNLITQYWVPPTPWIFGFLFVFLGSMILGSLLLKILAMTFNALDLDWLDALMGMFFGLIIGLLILWLCLGGSRKISNINQSDWWQRSLLITPIMLYGDLLWANYWEYIANSKPAPKPIPQDLGTN